MRIRTLYKIILKMFLYGLLGAMLLTIAAFLAQLGPIGWALAVMIAYWSVRRFLKSAGTGAEEAL